ncbi:MAG: DUF456 domain-containing protein [Flavobacteriaceae bacterium]|nr:DUF456 domain-containing protein [Flavobacteriaceae bacterium]
MDLFYLTLSFLFMLLGLIGCFFPVIPGPLTGWFGFLFLYQIEQIKTNKTLLIITFIIAFLIFLLDYIIPILGTKIFGGSRKGVIGASVGLIGGIIFLGPFGLLIGPFLGALIGELINDNKNFGLAVKASLGTILGLISGFVLKFSVACVFFIIYIFEVWEFKFLFF